MILSLPVAIQEENEEKEEEEEEENDVNSAVAADGERGLRQGHSKK